MNHFIFISEFAVYTFYHTSSGQWHDWTRCLIDMHQCRQGLQVPHQCITQALNVHSKTQPVQYSERPKVGRTK